MSNFAVRAIAGVVGVLILIGVLYIGGFLLNFALFLLVILGLLELRNALKNINIKINVVLLTICSLFGLFEITVFKSLKLSFYLIFYAAAFDLLFFKENIETAAALTFSLQYLMIGFYSMALIENKAFIGLIFVIAYSTDTFAYLIGSKFGKHKLIPSVSPNKSIEGSIAGVIASVVFTVIYLNMIFPDYYDLFVAVVLGSVGSIISQSGDLVASRIKRLTNIKDFGSLIPGHGGVLDRFDSVIMLAPVIFALYNYFYI